nr:immunoglobulin light chain junction region [Macaca mulatta]
CQVYDSGGKMLF